MYLGIILQRNVSGLQGLTYSIRYRESNIRMFGDSPKCPQKKASFRVWISGTHRYSMQRAGIRRNRRMARNRATSRQGVMPRSGRLKDSKGIQAPMYTKHAQFKVRSITGEKNCSSVRVLKSPSHEIALPVVKALRAVNMMSKKKSCTCSKCS